MQSRKKTQKTQKGTKKASQEPLSGILFNGCDKTQDRKLYASHIAAEITAEGAGKLTEKMFNEAVSLTNNAVENACLRDHGGNLGAMKDTKQSVGYHNEDVWNKFVDAVTARCKHYTNDKARLDEIECEAFACFLADVAIGLGMAQDELKPFTGTKPLGITKAAYAKKKFPCQATYQTEVEQAVIDYRTGTLIRLHHLELALIADELATGDDAHDIAKTMLKGEKQTTLQISDAYRKADQCINRKSVVPMDVAAVITNDLKGLISKCKDTQAKAVAEQRACGLCIQYTLAIMQTIDALNSNPHFEELTPEQRSAAIKACLGMSETLTEIHLPTEEDKKQTDEQVPAEEVTVEQVPAEQVPAEAENVAKDENVLTEAEKTVILSELFGADDATKGGTNEPPPKDWIPVDSNDDPSSDTSSDSSSDSSDDSSDDGDGADAEADGIPLGENTTAKAPAPGQAQTTKELEELENVLATPSSPFGGYSSTEDDDDYRRPKRCASRSLSNGSKAHRV